MKVMISELVKIFFYLDLTIENFTDTKRRKASEKKNSQI